MIEVAEEEVVASSMALLVLACDKRVDTEGSKDDAHLNIYQVE